MKSGLLGRTSLGLEQCLHKQKEITCNLFPFPIPACFADEELPLDADGAAILSETFNILSLKEMKLQAISAPAGSAAGEEPEEENMATMAKVVLQAARKKVVSQVSNVGQLTCNQLSLKCP